MWWRPSTTTTSHNSSKAVVSMHVSHQWVICCEQPLCVHNLLYRGVLGHPLTLNQTSLLSAHCRHIILVGQDKRELGALVFPDEDYLAAAAAPAGDAAGSSATPSSGAAPGGGVLAGAALEEVLFKEVARLNSGRPDYHPEDHIAHIKVGATCGACH